MKKSILAISVLSCLTASAANFVAIIQTDDNTRFNIVSPDAGTPDTGIPDTPDTGIPDTPDTGIPDTPDTNSPLISSKWFYSSVENYISGASTSSTFDYNTDSYIIGSDSRYNPLGTSDAIYSFDYEPISLTIDGFPPNISNKNIIDASNLTKIKTMNVYGLAAAEANLLDLTGLEYLEDLSIANPVPGDMHPKQLNIKFGNLSEARLFEGRKEAQIMIGNMSTDIDLTGTTIDKLTILPTAESGLQPLIRIKNRPANLELFVSINGYAKLDLTDSCGDLGGKVQTVQFKGLNPTMNTGCEDYGMPSFSMGGF
ncbi:hypothetical protein AB6C47_018280 [Vibrio cyclitrophicus]